ncbi:35150_t:CDS:1, partial [Gigaspora margarita]
KIKVGSEFIYLKSNNIYNTIWELVFVPQNWYLYPLARTPTLLT